MTEDEMMVLGAYASDLLQHPSFLTLWSVFERTTADLLLATRPSETTVREQMYARLTGAREFLDFLHDAVKTAQALGPKQPDELDQIDDPSVHDIYKVD
jgi:hypothetical protein